MTTRPELAVERPSAPNVQTKTITLDSDSLSLSADVSDYVAYIKADELREHLQRSEADDIAFYQGSTPLNHECVRRTRLFHYEASHNTHGVRPIVANGALYGTAVAGPSFKGIYIYKIDLDTFEKTEFELDTAHTDDHGPGGLFISGDGYITAFWTDHGSTDSLYWRRSTNPWDVSAWGDEQEIPLGSGGTYAMVHQISAQKGIVITRASSTGWNYAYTTDGGATWSDKQRLVGVVNYFWVRSRGGLVFDALMTDSASDETMYHAVVTFSDDLSTWSWAKADGTSIADTTPDSTDGDEVFGTADATGNQQLRVTSMDRLGDDLYCMLMVHPSGAETPAEYHRAVYSSGSWTVEKILDCVHNLIEPADIDGLMGADFDWIGDATGNTVFAVGGGHPAGDYGYQIKRMTRASDGQWHSREVIKENPFFNSSAHYGIYKAIQPRGWLGESLTKAKHIRLLWVDGYLDTLQTKNGGIGCWPGVPDAYYVKIPTLSKDANTTITAEVGHNRNTGRERRDRVWSDYEVVLHGEMWPASHQLVNSCYLNASDDPSAMEWPMTTSSSGRFNFTDSPLGGQALLEPGSTSKSAHPDISDPWVTEDTIDWSSVNGMSAEFYCRNALTHANAQATFYGCANSANTARIIMMIAHSGDGSPGNPNCALETSVSGWTYGSLDGDNAGLFTADEWHYVCFQHDGSEIAGYVDGVKSGSRTANGTLDTVSTVGPHAILNRAASSTYPFDGEMAEFRLSKMASLDRMIVTNANFNDYTTLLSIE